MSRKIIIDLSGDRVSLDALGEVLVGTTKLLHELDKIVSARRTIEWEVAGLRFGSARIITEPRLLRAGDEDRAGEIMELFQSGLQTLEGARTRPNRYTDKALEHAKGLTSVLSARVRKLTYFVEHGDSKSEPIPVTQRIAASVDELIEKGRVSHGTLEGTVEVLEGIQEYFSIQDDAHNLKIRCDCGKETLAEIARLHWERRVAVEGEITEDRQGRPKSIKVARVHPMPALTGLPQPEDLLGLYKSATNA